MSVSKEITIYEPPEDDIQSKKTHALLTSHDVNLTDSFLFKEKQQHISEFIANKSIISSLPSMMVKNIIYHALPIVEPENEPSVSTYKIHIQLPMSINVAVLGRGIKIKKANEIISMIGLYFDTDTTFLQTTNVSYNFKDINFNERTLLGINAFRELQFRYRYVYVPRFIPDITQNKTSLAISPYKCAIRFKSKQDALQKISILTSLIMSRLDYFKRMFETTMNHIYATNVLSSSIIVRRNENTERTSTDSSGVFKILEQILDISFDKRDNEFILSTIHSLGLWHFYVRATLHGIEDEHVQNDIANMRKKMLTARIAINHKHKKNTIKSNYAWVDNIARREFQTDYIGLTDIEKTTVDAQLVREKEIVKATLANKCPHLPLLCKVMRSRRDTFDTQSWSELCKFVPLKPKPAINGVIKLPRFESLLQCSLCKLWALCPHHYVLFDFKDTMFKGDVSKQMEYIITNFSVDKHESSDTFYCRICGEVLQRVVVEGESWFAQTRDSNELRNDSLYNIMKAEVWQTITANLEIGNIIIDRNDLATNIVEIINPYIRRYEVKLSRVKTNTENMVSFSLYLIISAYTFVTIIHLANITNGEIGLKGAQNRGDTGMKLLHRLFNKAYKLLTLQRAATINNVPAFTPDRIKKIMTRGYQQISGSQIDIETTTVSYDNNFIVFNPVYNYIHYGWRLGSLIKGEQPVEITDVKKILGVEFEDIGTLKMLFDKASLPPQWSTPKNDQWLTYMWDVYIAAAKRFLTNTYLLNNKYREEIVKEHNEFKARRKVLMKEREKYMNICHGNHFPDKPSTHLDVPALGLIYCDNGSKHKWDIYIYAFDGKNPTQVEVKTNEFGKKNIAGMTFIARKCSICGDLFGKTNHEKIKPVLNQQRHIKNFFIYYSNRCPVKYIHVWKDKTCIQCNITKLQLEKHNVKYYDKYKETFVKIRQHYKKSQKEQTTIFDERLRRRRGMMVVKKKTSFISYKQWDYRNDSVTKLSKTVSIPYNILINLGFLRNVRFDTAIKGKVNPSNKSTDEQWLMQVSVIGSYINDIDSMFNRFIRCNTAGMHVDLEEFCKTSHDEVRQLTPINLTQYNNERSVRKRDKPRLYANWMLVSLCDILLNIYNSQVSKKISQRFVEIYVQTMIESELNMSKPELYKKVVAAAKQLTDNITYDNQTDLTETDTSTKQFIDTLDNESFATNDIDVDDFAASTGADEI